MVYALLKFSESVPLTIIIVKVVREMLFAEPDLLLYLVFLKLFLVKFKLPLMNDLLLNVPQIDKSCPLS